MLLVYFSANSEYTHRFVAKLHHPAVRLPTLTKEHRHTLPLPIPHPLDLTGGKGWARGPR